MNILITGVTETHINHPDRAGSTKFISIPELMSDGFTKLGHQVDHRAVELGEDLSIYDKVFVYLYPLDKNAVDPAGAVYALAQRKDAYVCLDDWSFQKILPTWKDDIDMEDIQSRTWLAPLFPWGNIAKMNLPVAKIQAWDPSPLYAMPPVHKVAWKQRKAEWYNASLSKDSHEWAAKQELTWPIHAIGGKSLGQPRILESDVVWQYGSYKGVLCPTYSHAGCGWWRVRYLHAAAAGCVLGGNPLELNMIGPSYSFTLKGLEMMDDENLEHLAGLQAMDLKHATLAKTLANLESFLK
jgi:hypothetical protein